MLAFAAAAACSQDQKSHPASIGIACGDDSACIDPSTNPLGGAGGARVFSRGGGSSTGLKSGAGTASGGAAGATVASPGGAGAVTISSMRGTYFDANPANFTDAANVTYPDPAGTPTTIAYGGTAFTAPSTQTSGSVWVLVTPNAAGLHATVTIGKSGQGFPLSLGLLGSDDFTQVLARLSAQPGETKGAGQAIVRFVDAASNPVTGLTLPKVAWASMAASNSGSWIDASTGALTDKKAYVA